ncbi:phosphoribosylanthranilate isomerase [Pseudomonas seleniipraecipitans]|uniref:N-(5'-phosphoribosyl)anthranilate isomerase n=1 Tax=Phytopseudomonas seleniipraecipitans TaxID=640205 RepID=A0ABY5JEU4_9GAMM|nr:phosphoribosylanthranilate isomerase [Pseudomonas seleniipraecipitans]UUD64945.1 phosphoribosylanthranilate isomerase [Pseudomonas seleniipraecipitans]
MSVVRCKICGITRLEDALAAVAAGADAIGLVFYARSPRSVSIEQARSIVAGLPPFVTTVGLFVDMPQAEIEQVLAAVPLDLLQFHGDESAADCDALKRPYIKALRVRAQDDVTALVDAYPDARAVLLDTFVDGVPGGTGQAFDWALVPARLGKPVILAGGLTLENVAAAIAQVQPYAVDVSGGVELAKGIKDAAKVKDFVRAVRTVEGSM